MVDKHLPSSGAWGWVCAGVEFPYGAGKYHRYTDGGGAWWLTESHRSKANTEKHHVITKLYASRRIFKKLLFVRDCPMLESVLQSAEQREKKATTDEYHLIHHDLHQMPMAWIVTS